MQGYLAQSILQINDTPYVAALLAFQNIADVRKFIGINDSLFVQPPVINNHHRSQRTPARSGGAPHPGPSARSGEGPPTTNTSGPPARSGGGPHPGPSAGSGEGTPTQNPQLAARTTPCKPADLSQEWRRPDPHQHQRTPARGGGKPHPRPSCRSGGGPPAATGGEPHPGEAGTRTQATRPGMARSRPPTTTAPPHPGETGNPSPQTTQRKGRRDERGPGETQAWDPTSGVLWAPPVTVSAPPEHMQ